MTQAGLLLRVDRADPGLERLRAALGRALAGLPKARFASLFLDAPVAVEVGAAAALAGDLAAAGVLAPGAEITWHGDAGNEAAASALGVSRRSWPRLPAGWPHPGAPGPHAVDLGPRELRRCTAPWLRRLMEAGVVHLGLRGGSLPAEAVERLDGLARGQGLRRYEAVHWALPGHEARWLLGARRGAPILGMGPGAYGRWPGAEGWRWWRGGPGNRWRRAVDAGGDGRGRLHRLAAADQARERAIDGLRLAEGIDLGVLERETGAPAADWLDLGVLEALLPGQRLRRTGDRIAVADLGEADTLAAGLLRWP
ncbi:hypothetical protein [Geminicoccus roseus]|uniref:hypothetical protein n=1 Tax=Geminicoccus roseus TaxID=404900 RepID=UPI0003F88900|nr:hypothetical protein [Geminicoccus roseus]